MHLLILGYQNRIKNHVVKREGLAILAKTHKFWQHLSLSCIIQGKIVFAVSKPYSALDSYVSSSHSSKILLLYNIMVSVR